MKFINWWVRVNTATTFPRSLRNWYRRHPFVTIGIQASTTGFMIWAWKRQREADREFSRKAEAVLAREPQYLSRGFAHDSGEPCFCAGAEGCWLEKDAALAGLQKKLSEPAPD